MLVLSRGRTHRGRFYLSKRCCCCDALGLSNLLQRVLQRPEDYLLL